MPDLKERVPQRFIIKRDTVRDLWMIFDAWHPAVQGIVDLNMDIPESSPAIKIVTGSEVNALIQELKAEGVLDVQKSELVIPQTSTIKPEKKITKEDVAVKAIDSMKQIVLGLGLGDEIGELMEKGNIKK